MTHIFRAVVRGMFADPSDECRSRLEAAAPEHDIFLASYTADGTFTYEPRLVAFSFRYGLRVADPDGAVGPADAEAVVAAQAQELAVSYLGHHRIPYKRLRTTVTNMADMWHDDEPAVDGP